MIDNRAAVAHFNRHMDAKALLQGPWAGLTRDEVKADVQTADWVPNRASWRAQGFRNRAHAEAVIRALQA